MQESGDDNEAEPSNTAVKSGAKSKGKAKAKAKAKGNATKKNSKSKGKSGKKKGKGKKDDQSDEEMDDGDEPNDANSGSDDNDDEDEDDDEKDTTKDTTLGYYRLRDENAYKALKRAGTLLRSSLFTDHPFPDDTKREEMVQKAWKNAKSQVLTKSKARREFFFFHSHQLFTP